MIIRQESITETSRILFYLCTNWNNCLHLPEFFVPMSKWKRQCQDCPVYREGDSACRQFLEFRKSLEWDCPFLFSYIMRIGMILPKEAVRKYAILFFYGIYPFFENENRSLPNVTRKFLTEQRFGKKNDPEEIRKKIGENSLEWLQRIDYFLEIDEKCEEADSVLLCIMDLLFEKEKKEFSDAVSGVEKFLKSYQAAS